MTATTDARCWTLKHTSGPDIGSYYDDGEGALHFPTSEAAIDWRNDRDDRGTEPAQFPFTCHTITCGTAGCGYRYEQDSDDAAVTHFPSREEGVRWVLLTGWGASPNGPICTGCVENALLTP